MSNQRTISFQEAKDLFEGYKNDAANQGQTQQVYFNYQELMNYLNSIAASVAPAEVHRLGIKVYFGQYAVDYTETEKQGRRTVFFVPCITTEVNGQLVKQDMLSDINSGQWGGQDVEAYNHGTTCPPYTGTDPSGQPICEGSDFD